MRTFVLLLALVAVSVGSKSAARPVSKWQLVACWRAPDRAYVYYECQFSSTRSLGAIQTRVWHWGSNFAADDTTTDSVARHIYVPGKYRVKMTVYDSAGLKSYHSDTITVPTNLIPLPRDTVVVHVGGIFIDSMRTDSAGRMITPRTIWITLKAGTLHDSAGQLLLCQRLWGPPASTGGLLSSVPSQPCATLFPSIDSVLKALAVP